MRAFQTELGTWLDRAAAQLDGISPEILLVILALPLLLAIISGRWHIILGTIFFWLASVVVLTRPSLAASAIASVMWVIGMLMAVAAISLRRSHREIKAQLDYVQDELNQLQARESQRYFAELRYGHPPTEVDSKPAEAKPQAPEPATKAARTQR